MTTDSSILSVTKASQSFGGIDAFHGVRLEGPNRFDHGAHRPQRGGKTTLMDVVTGFVPSSGARIDFGRPRHHHLSAEKTARARLVPLFHAVREFTRMTSLGNLLYSYPSRHRTGICVWGRSLGVDGEENENAAWTIAR